MSNTSAATATATAENEKSVVFDVAIDSLSGGGKRRRRRTRKAVVDSEKEGEGHSGGHSEHTATPITVEKETHPQPKATKPPQPPQQPQQPQQPAHVVISPPKKRAPKLLLVPSSQTKRQKAAALAQKTFKAHRVRVLIDNTARTQKRRRQTLQAIDAMTDEQLRAAAVSAKLSKTETVAKVPKELLRQMLKDYRMMRGMLV